MKIEEVKIMLTRIGDQVLENLQNDPVFTEKEKNPYGLSDEETIEVEKHREQIIRKINELHYGKIEKACKEYARVPFDIHYDARDEAKKTVCRQKSYYNDEPIMRTKFRVKKTGKGKCVALYAIFASEEDKQYLTQKKKNTEVDYYDESYYDPYYEKLLRYVKDEERSERNESTYNGDS